ncbi:hypothetical protein SAMN04487786_3132 [Paenisporosarcina quisquiliarum]|nr:hypothetical protein [Psychrobacillus psychrodurans]SEN05004.1 hypothetical protein SAMN04487786_3132 [Paenisporosarcina quisquiliarum]
MKKVVFGVLLCFVLFTLPVLSSNHLAEDDKPKITSVGDFI